MLWMDVFHIGSGFLVDNAREGRGGESGIGPQCPTGGSAWAGLT